MARVEIDDDVIVVDSTFNEKELVKHEDERREHEAERNRLKKNINVEVAAALKQAEDVRTALHKTLTDPMKAHNLISNIEEWKEDLRRIRAS